MRHALILSLVAFVLHFAWENVQCPLLYVHGSYDATWSGMVWATAGDVLLTWTIYAFVATLAGRWHWAVGAWGSKQWIAMTVAAIALGVAIELRALATGRWSYTPGMPVVPGLGVGFVPVAQLLVLTPVSIRLAFRVAPRAPSSAPPS